MGVTNPASEERCRGPNPLRTTCIIVNYIQTVWLVQISDFAFCQITLIFVNVCVFLYRFYVRYVVVFYCLLSFLY